MSNRYIQVAGTNKVVEKPVLVDHFTHGDEQVATHAQDISRIFNFCEEQRKNSDENWKLADPDIKPVARIPRVVWMALQRQGLTDTDAAKELMQWLELFPMWKRTEKTLEAKPPQYHDLGRIQNG
jgi:hypothetical protein